MTDGLSHVIYALEWYNIPWDDYFNLVKFHPYLTYKHLSQLEDIEESENVELILFFALSSLLSTKVLNWSRFMKYKLVRIPSGLLLGAGLTFLFD